jgi:hypothetical protein
MLTRTLTNRRIHHIHTNRNGGFICYAKLTVQLWSQLFSLNSQLKEIGINRWKYCFLIFLSLLKTPYWLFIKPLFFIFSKRTTYQGNYTIEDGDLNKNHSVKKTVVYFCFGIPFFMYKSKPNTKDWNFLLNQ